MRCTPCESGLAEVERSLGADYPALVDGAPRPGQSSFEERSPIDIDLVIGTFADLLQPTSKTPSARRERPRRWAATPWQERAALLDKART